MGWGCIEFSKEHYPYQRDWCLCKAQPHRAPLGYPFHNTAAHTEATPTREGI